MEFRHRYPIQVRWGDMDALRHVNNATFLTYCEQARIHYFGEVMGGRGETPGLILARVVIDYKLPLVASDEVSVHTRCSRLGRSSFDMTQWIMRGDDPAAQAVVTTVVYDYSIGKSTPMPELWREKIKAYEPTAPDE